MSIVHFCCIFKIKCLKYVHSSSFLFRSSRSKQKSGNSLTTEAALLEVMKNRHSAVDVSEYIYRSSTCLSG